MGATSTVVCRCGQGGFRAIIAGRSYRFGQSQTFHHAVARRPRAPPGRTLRTAGSQYTLTRVFSCGWQRAPVIIELVTDQRNTRVPQFFLTPGGPCPYLPGRIERKVFARLTGPLAQPLSEALTHSGFRRSQSIAYRPACEGCNACVSVRIVARRISPEPQPEAHRPAQCRPVARHRCRRKRRASNSRCCAPIWIRAIPAAA